ncbi:MAG: UTP--glucose-1-phosphate uridylyltransferase [Phycisphaerae bacterium]
MTHPAHEYDAIEHALHSAGQGHLVTQWPALSESQRQSLLDDIRAIDLALCRELAPRYVTKRPAAPLPLRVEPPTILPADPGREHTDLYRRARARGEASIRGGKVAAFTVAGGQGTRLGFDGPKGAFRISPVRNVSLFQLFAEYLLGVRRRFDTLPRWYIMTSPTNHAETVAFFAQHQSFGLPPDSVRFFQQGQMPAFLPDGRIAMRARDGIALSPDGHGGSLRALAASGALREMAEHGVEYISYFQVDNPLVKPIDPLFVGLHAELGSEMSSKAVTKADDLERVGNFCVADGKLQVIEYSDLPESLARARNADGSRRFDAGSIAIHVLSRSFVERLTAPGAAVQLPWHRADKKSPVWDPAKPNDAPRPRDVVKLELFIFDAIPLAQNPLVLYTPREEEFSPVKNAEGVDSPATSRRDQVRRAARWLERCGTKMPRDARGEPTVTLEISPAYALDVDDLRSRFNTAPFLEPGGSYVLA